MSRKAYLVTDEEDYSEVVFAETPGKAKLMPDWWSDVDFTDLRARRAPTFDDIQGRVTGRHYVERGWRTFCGWCDCSVCDEEDDSEYTPASKAVFDDRDTAYCSEECRQKAQDSAKVFHRCLEAS